MKSGQGFLLVFSITSLSSLNELYELREQIVRIKDDERVPLVIVGNKSDLDDDRAVSRARAHAVSEGWGHAPYYETSARRRANVDEAFKDLCRQIMRKDGALDKGAAGFGGGGDGDGSGGSLGNGSGFGSGSGYAGDGGEWGGSMGLGSPTMAAGLWEGGAGGGGGRPRERPRLGAPGARVVRRKRKRDSIACSIL